MNRVSAWLRAARPLLQAGIVAPLVYGQALAFAVHGTFRLRIALVVHLFGVLDGLLIAFSNDAADWQADVRNTTFTRHSGGSRVVPMGLLTPFQLAQGAILALFALGTTSAYLVFREGRAWMVVLAAISAHLVWIHGFPPFRLGYRGLGDLVAGIILGLVLPVVGFYAQANTLEGLRAATLFPAFLAGYAVSVTTSVPDAPSDALVDKRPLAVRRGERAARSTSVALLAIAALGASLAVPGAPLSAVVAVIAVGLALALSSVPLVGSADSSNPDACSAFVGKNLRAALGLFLLWAAAAVVVSGRG